MDESFWYIIELVGFILAGAMLIVNIILFIRLEIPALIGELSGRRYEKEVKQIRASYVDYDKRNRIRKQRAQRRENPSQNPIERMSQEEWHPERQQPGKSTDVIYQSDESTTVLSEQTTLLQNQEVTSVLKPDTQFKIVRELFLVHTDERIEEIYS